MTADQNFLPDVGFMRRSAFSRNSVYARYSPRPASKIIRKMFYEGVYDYITDPGNRLESRLGQVAVRSELQNGDGACARGRGRTTRRSTSHSKSHRG